MAGFLFRFLSLLRGDEAALGIVLLRFLPAVAVGPIKVHWYGLTYIGGLAFAWWLARLRSAQPHSPLKRDQVDDLIFYAAIGVVLGQLSSSNTGRNFCLIVLLIAAVRLTLGGGFLGQRRGRAAERATRRPSAAAQSSAGCRLLRSARTRP